MFSSHVPMTPGLQRLQRGSAKSMHHKPPMMYDASPLFCSAPVCFCIKRALYFWHKELDMDFILSSHVRPFDFGGEFIDLQELRFATWATLSIPFYHASFEIYQLTRRMKQNTPFNRRAKGIVWPRLAATWTNPKIPNLNIKLETHLWTVSSDKASETWYQTLH